MTDAIKEVVKTAKARRIKKAALAIVAAYEHKCPDCGQGLDLDHAGCKGVEHDDKNGGWRVKNTKQAAPGDEPIQRSEPSTQADPPTTQPAPPVAPVQPVAETPVEEVEEVEEAEETPEAKKVRWRTELESELNDDDLITAVIEFLEAESLDLDDYGVTVSDGHFFGSANVELGKNTSYVVCKSDDDAEAAATNQVREDMDNEPELFNQDFLTSYIDEEHLRDQLSSDVEEMIRETPDSYGWEAGQDADGNELVRYNSEGEEEDEGEYDSDGQPFVEQTEPSDEWIEQKVAEQLRDPIQYMKDIYGEEDGLKHAMEIGGIDRERAVSDAVAADGWQHFLCRYDGNSSDLPSGGVYWHD